MGLRGLGFRELQGLGLRGLGFRVKGFRVYWVVLRAHNLVNSGNYDKETLVIRIYPYYGNSTNTEESNGKEHGK